MRLLEYLTSYKNTLAEVIKAKYSLADIQLEKVTFEFINAYDLFLKQTHNLHKNAINKHHSRLRAILRAFAEGVISKQPYSGFKPVTIKSDRGFLSQVDLNKIIQADLSHNKSLEKVRDLFIFSCYNRQGN